MPELSVTIITKNEETNIRRCLQSVKWADEIVVVDSGSTDDTLEICRSYPCNIIETEWLGFGRTKQLAVEHASNDWILSIDADEEVTEPLKDQLTKILKAPKVNAYKIRRKSFYLGKMIRFCGWNKDYPLRLFNKKLGYFDDRIVHEGVVIKDKKGMIQEALLHYTYPTIESHIKKMSHYSSLGAQILYEKGKRATLPGAILKGAFKFLKMYFFQLGFLDGKNGLVLSINSAYGVYLKYLKIWQMTK